MLFSRIIFCLLAGGSILPASLCAQNKSCISERDGRRIWMVSDSVTRRPSYYLEDTLTKARTVLNARDCGWYYLEKCYIVGKQGDMKALLSMSGELLVERCHYIRFNNTDSIVSAFVCGSGWRLYDYRGNLLASHIAREDGCTMDNIAPSPHGPFFPVPGCREKYALMDKNGTWITMPVFDYIGAFSDGKAQAGLYGKQGTIDTKGVFTEDSTGKRIRPENVVKFPGMGPPYRYKGSKEKVAPVVAPAPQPPPKVSQPAAVTPPVTEPPAPIAPPEKPKEIPAPPENRWKGYTLMSVSGSYRIWSLKSERSFLLAKCFLEDTVTHSVAELPAAEMSRYEIRSGYIYGYGTNDSKIVQMNGRVVISGYRHVDFLPGDTLIFAYNSGSWGYYNLGGTLLASGTGAREYQGRPFFQLDDSTLVVPGPENSWGIMDTGGRWLSLPLFAWIRAGDRPGNFTAGLYNGHGVLTRDGMYTDETGVQTDARIHGPFYGMGAPYRCRKKIVSGDSTQVIDTLYSAATIPGRPRWTISQRYREYNIIMSTQRAGLMQLVNNSTHDTIALPVHQPSGVVPYTFSPPFIAVTYYSGKAYYSTLLDLEGKQVIPDFLYVQVLPEDSTIICSDSSGWKLLDWEFRELSHMEKMYGCATTGNSIQYVNGGRYCARIVLDSIRMQAVYYLTDKTGRKITAPVFSGLIWFSPGQILSHATLCGGIQVKVDTAGNIFYPGDPFPHRLTPDSLLANKAYRKINARVNYSHRIDIQVNPYCYDRHTSTQVGDWRTDSYYLDGALVMQTRYYRKRHQNQHGRCVLTQKETVRYKDGASWKRKKVFSEGPCPHPF